MRVHLLLSLLIAAACERAGQEPPTEAPLPTLEAEPLVPEVIEAQRSRVEHPPPLPPGAAWFHRLTAREQQGVEWVCRAERNDPCWGPHGRGLRVTTAEEDARYDAVAPLLGRDFERHCTQELGPRRGCNTPLVVAFDGEAIAFRQDARAFAFRGEPVISDWPTAKTPWLALDRDGDGMITRGDELFGDGVPGARNGYEALAQLDANGDGIIDANDPAFASLVLWADRDGDRRGEPDELTPLADLVVAIPLAHARDVRCTARGNCEGERGALVRRDGARGAVVDVYLPER
ncbi:MAG: hypothetical protein JO257_32025 [Deltaproteobacteria bacterium]|nr:hypothetical protein [Deltaproteobacteria bacterium]